MKVFLKICEHDNAKFVSKLLILVLFFSVRKCSLLIILHLYPVKLY